MDPDGQTSVERWLLVCAVLGVLCSAPARHARLKVHLLLESFGMVLVCLSWLTQLTLALQDYILVVPEDSYTPQYLQEEPLDKSYDFISSCGINSFYIK